MKRFAMNRFTMNRWGLIAAVAALGALPSCTTFNPDRRQLTEWNLGLIKEHRDPCGTMSAEPAPTEKNSKCGALDNMNGSRVIDWVFVKPIAFVMLPISWLGDTLLLNPIDGYKKAELDTHERRFCQTEAHPEWSDAHAAHHAYGVIPVATPWVVSEALALPEFAARWVWNSVTPTAPVNQDDYNAYWRMHNETTGQ